MEIVASLVEAVRSPRRSGNTARSVMSRELQQVSIPAPLIETHVIPIHATYESVEQGDSSSDRRASRVALPVRVRG